MIDIKTLASNLAEKLNNNSAGLEFNIATDTCNFVRPYREGNTVHEPINCLMSSTSAEVSNLVSGTEGDNLVYATQNCTLKVIMGLPDEEDDVSLENKGYTTKISNLRAVLNNVFQGLTTEPMTDNNGKSYSVTTVYQFASSGQREIASMIGDSFSFYCYVTYLFVENGVNTKDMTFMIDGAIIPYQLCTVYRTPSMDGNVYANTKNGATKNISSQSNFNVSFELPAMVGKIFEMIQEYIIDGVLNRAHLLRFKFNGVEREYIVTFGENSVLGETIKNANLRISIVEAPDEYELINFGNNYHIYEVSDAQTEIKLDDNAQAFVFGSVQDFVRAVNGVASVNVVPGDILVSTAKLSNETGFEVIKQPLER